MSLQIYVFQHKNPTDEMYEALRPVVKLAKELDIPLEVNANGFKELNTNKATRFKYY